MERIISQLEWETLHAAGDLVAKLEGELQRIRSGEVVVMPVSREHAAAMHLLSERFLKDNPVK